MDRRSLLRRGVAGAVAAVAGPSLARAASVVAPEDAPPAPVVPPARRAPKFLPTLAMKA